MTTSVDDTDRTTSPDGPGGGRPGRRRLSPARLAVLVVALGALLAVYIGTRREAVAPPDQQATATGIDERPIDPLTGNPEGYRTYTDDATGFTLAHPETWVPLRRPGGEIRLALSAGGDNSLLVRYRITEEPIDTEADLQTILPVTDRLVSAGGARVVKRQAFNLNGINGITYLSRNFARGTEQELVNAHYFLFQGRKMFILLFQVVPPPSILSEDAFERIVPDVNAVLDSFKIEPGEAPPVPAG